MLNEGNQILARTQVAIALVSVASFLGVLYATAPGAGASPDSVTYVQIARNFVQGHGLSQLGPNSTHLPVTQYPPAFPLLLGIVGKAGIDPVDAARWINALLSACTTLLIAAWVQRATGKRLWPALIAALIFVGSSANLTVYSMIWSEPFFLLTVLGALYLLYRYEESRATRTLVCSGLLFSLSSLTRYAGLFFCLAGGAYVLWLFLRSPDRKRASLFYFAAACAGPISLWLMRNILVAQSATNMSLVYHAIPAERILRGLTVAATWFLPGRLANPATGALVLVVLAGFSLADYRRLNRPKTPGNSCPGVQSSVRILTVCFVTYFFLLVLSMTFLNAYTPFNIRILSPLYVCLLITLVLMGHRNWEWVRHHRLLKPVTLGILATWLLFSTTRGVLWVHRAHHEGQGYASTEWRESGLIQYIQNLPCGERIWSNAPDAIYFLTGREATMIPTMYNPSSTMQALDYSIDLANWYDRLRRNQGLLVWFDQVRWRLYLPPISQIVDAHPFRLVIRRRWQRVRGGIGQRPTVVSLFWCLCQCARCFAMSRATSRFAFGV